MSNDVLDFFGGGGIPSATFHTIGDSITGTISEPPITQQQTEMGTGKPLTFEDGSPRMMLVITLQTTLRDKDIEDDSGLRRVYVTGTKVSEGGGMKGAFQRAGIRELAVGGTLTVKYTHDGARTSPGFNPPKQYEVIYAPPNAASGFLGGGGSASATAAPANGSAAEQLPPGMTPEVWAGLSDEVKAALKVAASPA